MGQVMELVVTLLAMDGVSRVLESRQATRKYVVERLVELAKAIIEAKCKNGCEANTLMGLVASRVQSVVIPGSTVNIASMVKELHIEAHDTVNLVEAILERQAVTVKGPLLPGMEDGEANAPVDATVEAPVEAPVETPVVDPPQQDAAAKIKAFREASISVLNLPTKARNAFITEPLTTVGSLVDYKKARPLSDVKGIGEEMEEDTIEAIKAYAAAQGVNFEDL